MEKIFLISDTNTDLNSLAMKIVELDSSLNISRKFSTELDVETIFKYKRDMNDILLDYKNNSLMYVAVTNETNYEGITLDEYYNKDIFCLTYKDFNNISEYIIRNSETVFVWIDNDTESVSKSDMNESKVFANTIINEYLKCLYFYKDADYIIADTIIKYVNGTPTEKHAILEEFS